MSVATRARGVGNIAAVALIAGLCSSTALSVSRPAEARVFVGFGFGVPIGFPGYFYPPYPYPYYPPPAYYPPPPYYPPLPASYQPSTAYAPPGGYTQPGSPAAPPITYTPRPGWTNAQGQYCREYKATQRPGSRATERYGTACRDAGGQWRVVN